MIGGRGREQETPSPGLSHRENLVLQDASPSPWTVTFDGVPQPINLVQQAGGLIFLQTTAGGAAMEIRLSYSGGGFVTGEMSGLPLAPVMDFPVGIV